MQLPAPLPRLSILLAAGAGLLSSGCGASLGPARVGTLDPLPLRDPGAVTFAVVGDMGRFEADARKHLACHSRAACKARGGCDFSVLLGDNLYDAGITGPQDACRLGAMVAAYPGKRRLLILGNHDYHKLWPSRARAEAQLKWIGDHRNEGVLGAFHFYRVEAGPVQLWGLDSNMLVRDPDRVEQPEVARFGQQLRDSSAPWRIVMGHHPYLSRGKHGNAGSYRDGDFELWSGKAFQAYMQQHVLGHAQLYLAGHEHNIQFYTSLDEQPTAQLVSGSGAACTEPPDQRNDARPELLRYGYGFALVDATAERLRVTIHDERGVGVWQSWRSRTDPKWHFRLLASPTPMTKPCSQPTRACSDGKLDKNIEKRYRKCIKAAGG